MKTYHPLQIAASFNSSIVLLSNHKVYWFGTNGTIKMCLTPTLMDIKSKVILPLFSHSFSVRMSSALWGFCLRGVGRWVWSAWVFCASMARWWTMVPWGIRQSTYWFRNGNKRTSKGLTPPSFPLCAIIWKNAMSSCPRPKWAFSRKAERYWSKWRRRWRVWKQTKCWKSALPTPRDKCYLSDFINFWKFPQNFSCFGMTKAGNPPWLNFCWVVWI